MANKNKTLKEYLAENCTISKEDLSALKNKYGKIQIITVVIDEPVRDEEGAVIDAGEVYYFVSRRPTQKLIRMLKSLAKDEDKFISSAVKNLVVGGDMDALDDGLVYIGIASQLQSILKPYTSFLTKA